VVVVGAGAVVVVVGAVVVVVVLGAVVVVVVGFTVVVVVVGFLADAGPGLASPARVTDINGRTTASERRSRVLRPENDPAARCSIYRSSRGSGSGDCPQRRRRHRDRGLYSLSAHLGES